MVRCSVAYILRESATKLLTSFDRRCGRAMMLSQRKITILGISGPLYCQGSLVAKERSLPTGEAACVSKRAVRRVCTLRCSVGRVA